MTTRKKVFVQLRSFSGKRPRWVNDEAFTTYEEAVAHMREQQAKYPKAQFRVLDNNGATHTK